jgi:hypothetical protein
MHNRAMTKTPVTSFSIPGQAQPSAVAAAYREFERVSNSWAESAIELRDTEHAKAAAVAGAIREISRRRRGGQAEQA